MEDNLYEEEEPHDEQDNLGDHDHKRRVVRANSVQAVVHKVRTDRGTLAFEGTTAGVVVVPLDTWVSGAVRPIEDPSHEEDTPVTEEDHIQSAVAENDVQCMPQKSDTRYRTAVGGCHRELVSRKDNDGHAAEE